MVSVNVLPWMEPDTWMVSEYRFLIPARATNRLPFYRTLIHSCTLHCLTTKKIKENKLASAIATSGLCENLETSSGYRSSHLFVIVVGQWIIFRAWQFIPSHPIVASIIFPVGFRLCNVDEKRKEAPHSRLGTYINNLNFAGYVAVWKLQQNMLHRWFTHIQVWVFSTALKCSIMFNNDLTRAAQSVEHIGALGHYRKYLR